MRRIQTIEIRRGEGLGRDMSPVIERSHLRLKENGLGAEAAKIPPRNKTGTPAPKGSDLQAEMDGYRVQDPRRVKGTERKANLIIQPRKEKRAPRPRQLDVARGNCLQQVLPKRGGSQSLRNADPEVQALHPPLPQLPLQSHPVNPQPMAKRKRGKRPRRNKRK